MKWISRFNFLLFVCFSYYKTTWKVKTFLNSAIIYNLAKKFKKNVLQKIERTFFDFTKIKKKEQGDVSLDIVFLWKNIYCRKEKLNENLKFYTRNICVSWFNF